MNATSIRELRDSTGMSQTQFARFTHIPVSTLRKWEQGSASPPEYVLQMIARSLPYTRHNLCKIGSGEDTFYIDALRNTVIDRLGNEIPVKADLSKVKPHNLLIYLRDLFDSYYEITNRFERDCHYDEEEDILWSSEKMK